MMASFERFRFAAGERREARCGPRVPATPPQARDHSRDPLSSPPTARSATPSSSSSDSDASVAVRRHAFIAPAPARWRDAAPSCARRARTRVVCAYHPGRLPCACSSFGHNPSEHSWASAGPAQSQQQLLRAARQGRDRPRGLVRGGLSPRFPASSAWDSPPRGCFPGSDERHQQPGPPCSTPGGPSDAALRGHLRRASSGDGDVHRRRRPRRGPMSTVPGALATAAAAARAGRRRSPCKAAAGLDSASLTLLCLLSFVARVDGIRTRSTRVGPSVPSPRRGVGAPQRQRSRGGGRGGEGGGCTCSSWEGALAESRWPRDDVHVGEGVGGERASRGDETNRRRGRRRRVEAVDSGGASRARR